MERYTFNLKNYLRMAQIWKDPNIEGEIEEFNYNGDYFVEYLRALYALEYKWNAIRNFPFKGMEKRKDNIIARLEEVIYELQTYLLEALIHVFDGWIDNHRIDDPLTWAHNRFGLYYYDNLSEAISYIDGHASMTFFDWIEMVADDEELQNKFPYTGQYVQYLKDGYKSILEEMASGNEEEFLETYSFIGDSIQEILENYEDAFDFKDLHGNDVDAINNAEEMIYEWISDSVFETYKIMFPGVIDSVEEVGAAFSRLIEAQSSTDIGIRSSAINIALNTAHTTGLMIEHIQDAFDLSNLQKIFDDLTDMDVSHLNKQLRAVGVILPEVLEDA